MGSHFVHNNSRTQVSMRKGDPNGTSRQPNDLRAEGTGVSRGSKAESFRVWVRDREMNTEDSKHLN